MDGWEEMGSADLKEITEITEQQLVAAFYEFWLWNDATTSTNDSFLGETW